MPDSLTEVDVRTQAQWHKWLAKHHTSSPGAWVVRYKRHSGVECISYEDLVCEALCFGWVDSLVKSLDEDRYVIKVTPRRTASKWSESNRSRWRRLKAAGRLTEAGLAAAPTDYTYAPRPRVPALPGYMADALKAHPKAWKSFQSLAPSHRREYVVWICTAKRPETREKRILESIKLLSAGHKLGLK